MKSSPTPSKEISGRISDFLAKKWKNRFYLYLAAMFTALIVFDALFLHLTSEMRQTTFDMMVRYRVIVPKPDQDIVIVDINEATLAAMAKDYGRWPWPRQVLGEFLEHIEEQQPKAVIFDILFSDPDVYNPDSDDYFDAAIAATQNTYFPLLRLHPANDALSQVKPAMLPGVTPLEGAQPDATVAVVVPYFKSIVQGGRMGLHNIYPDSDGIARQYLAYLDDYGWKIPSLPLRIARDLGYAEPETRRFLLNWRGKPFSYHTVSFSEVYADFASKHRKRPADEFRNKIVIIGSTAPSLFDVKPTPISRMHPGVEILATAIDNLKHDDYLRFHEQRWVNLLLALAIVWATAWGFYRGSGQDKFDRLFGASQFILIAISYASINLTTSYVNLTGPVTIGLAYFTIARLYAFSTGRALEKSMVRRSLDEGGEFHAVLMLIRTDEHGRALSEGTRQKISRALEKTGRIAKSVEVLKTRQKGVWGLLEETWAISWVCRQDDTQSRAAIADDVASVSAAVTPLLQKMAAIANNETTWFVHEARIPGGEAARKQWRIFLAETLLQMDRSNPGSSDEA